MFCLVNKKIQQKFIWKNGKPECRAIIYILDIITIKVSNIKWFNKGKDELLKEWWVEEFLRLSRNSHGFDSERSFPCDSQSGPVF